MATKNAQPVHRRSDRFHPMIYKAMVVLALLLVVAAWGFFQHGDPTALLLAVVTIFFVVALGIPILLWRIWDRNAHAARPARSYRDWASGEFGIWQDHVKGRSATIEALLPIAAVAIGMVAFAIVLHFAV